MAIVEIVDKAFQIYSFLLLIRIIMSWIPLPDGPAISSVVQFVNDVTEPYLGIFRRLLPMASFGGMGVDFSPLLAFFVLGLVRELVMQILLQAVGA